MEAGFFVAPILELDRTYPADRATIYAKYIDRATIFSIAYIRATIYARSGVTCV